MIKTYAGWAVSIVLSIILVYVLYIDGHLPAFGESSNISRGDQSDVTLDTTATNEADDTQPTTSSAEDFSSKSLPDKAYREMKEKNIEYEWRNEKNLQITFEDFKNLATTDKESTVFFHNQKEYDDAMKDLEENPDMYEVSDPSHYDGTRLPNWLVEAPEVSSWQIPANSNVLLITFETAPTKSFALRGAEGFWDSVTIYIPE